MLLSPTTSDRRSALADWLEVNAITSARKMSSAGDLANIFDIAEDSTARLTTDEATGEILDQAILDEPRTAQFEATFSELEFRKKCLGDSYPFQVNSDRMTLRADFRQESLHYGQVGYAFCLLVTTLRERKISNIAQLESYVQQLPLYFQVCACLAAGGYFGGAVSSFGFPRAEGDAFIPALNRAYSRFGYGSAKASIEPGLPAQTKDGGIDVIAWLDHPDQLPSKLYSVGQTASGKDWKGKSVTQDVAPFHGNWFTESPATYFVPALYIPFLAYAELDEYDGATYSQARARMVASHERRFGLIFDRLRIAHHIDVCMRQDEGKRSRVDGVADIHAIAEWVNEVVGHIGGATR
ncbi:MAG: hypothetical protein GXD23_20065 [Comamonadaceae bacterium]|jgi:hypothetical protein|nr:hypothetical protein [Comamonadaceae bacterium]